MAQATQRHQPAILAARKLRSRLRFSDPLARSGRMSPLATFLSRALVALALTATAPCRAGILPRGESRGPAVTIDGRAWAGKEAIDLS
jgi:hypothetical protein